jgi:hypothetical protein
MLIILNDDRTYLSWLAHHRQGFVLDARRRPTVRQLVLHRALCPDIRSHNGKRTYWTSGARLKACSLRPGELVDWARHAAGVEPTACLRCKPQQELAPRELDSLVEPGRGPGLSRLCLRLLDHILDATIISLEQGRPYRVTVDAAAEAVGKRSSQVATALVRLLSEGYVATDAQLVPGVPWPGDAALRPTSRALRTLPAFRHRSAAHVAATLAALPTNG